ncbi:MAG: guanylate kinase [Acidobacteria bacterium]|nr:guanylate kinase [Acidobacteriota bacterium]
MSSRGNVIVISAPSGSGKTSLARGVATLPDLKFSISHTTREPRSGERHGTEYFFVSETEFLAMVQRQEFLEYAHVYGHYYGTSRGFVESTLNRGWDVLLDIDVQGALKVKTQVPDAVLVFVFPPSMQVLQERLRGRGLDDPEIIDKRLKIAADEISFFREYDYVIINEDIEKSILELKSIVLSARCRLKVRKQRAEEIAGTFGK